MLPRSENCEKTGRINFSWLSQKVLVESRFTDESVSSYLLTHTLTLPGQISSVIFFRLLIWYLMDATPTNNGSVFPRTKVTYNQNTPSCICLWALPSPCCQQFDHLFVWILPFDVHGLVRPARSRSFRQYSSQGRGITQAPSPLQGWWLFKNLKVI